MKSFVISIFTALLIVGGSVTYSFYIKNLSAQMCVYGEEIKQLVTDENFADAVSKISELSDFVDKTKPLLASTTDHANIDEIEQTVALLKIYTAQEQRPDALAKCELMNVLFEHLPKSYDLRLENIL